MRTRDLLGRIFAALAARLSGRREFTCGDCERREQCGLPPGETCVVRLAQMARSPEKWA